MNKKPPLVRVTFYKVKDNPTKLRLLCVKSQEAFQREKRLLIVVPNAEAAQYIDALLWRMPEEGFIPHQIADTAVSDWVAIALQKHQNVNKAECLFNLCPTYSTLEEGIEEIYDFYDETDQQKLEISKERMNQYRSKGYFVNSFELQ